MYRCAKLIFTCSLMLLFSCGGSSGGGGSQVPLSTNSAPQGSNSLFTIDEDTVLIETLPVSDPDGDSLTVSVSQSTSHGVLTMLSGSSVSPEINYVPNQNFYGDDTLTYTVSDGTLTAGPFNVAITVTSVNDQPVAANKSYSTPENTLLTVPAPGVRALASDNDLDHLTIITASPPANGTLLMTASGSFSYTPNPNFNGVDTFTYMVNDGVVDSALASVQISVLPLSDAPRAFDDEIWFPRTSSDPITVVAPGVLVNDENPDGDALSARVVNRPARGALAFETDGSFVYTPGVNFGFTDSFTYAAVNAVGESQSATVQITSINGTVFGGRDDSFVTREDTPLVVAAPGVLVNDILNLQSVIPTVFVLTEPVNGTVEMTLEGGFTYTPNKDFHGVDTFVYRFPAGIAYQGAKVTIAIEPQPDAPVIGDVNACSPTDTSIEVFFPRGVDNENDPLTFTITTPPSNGVLSNFDSMRRKVTYTPEPGFSGVDHFTYNANDGALDSADGYATVLVMPADALPKLSELSIDNGQFDQVFHDDLRDYTFTLPYLISEVKVTTQAEDPLTTILINDELPGSDGRSSPVLLHEGHTVIEIDVTSADGATSCTNFISTERNVERFAQRHYIKASNPDAEDGFGLAIALHGDTLVVGAPGEDGATSGFDGDQNDNNNVDSGAVYVFARSEGTWVQQAYLKASNPGNLDGFGRAVAVHGDTVVVGAQGEDSASTGVDGEQYNNNAEDAGAAYVFARDENGSWVRQGYLKASNTDPGDRFGTSVKVFNNTIAVAAPFEDSPAVGIDGVQTNHSSNQNSGAVYLFERDNAGDWMQSAYVKEIPRNSGPRWNEFGQLLHLSADSLVASQEPTWFSFYRRTGAVWVTDFGQNLGSPFVADLSVTENFLSTTSPSNIHGVSNAVGVYAKAATGNWESPVLLRAAVSDSNERLHAICMSAQSIVAISAAEDSASTGVNGDPFDNSSINSGAAYLFTPNEFGVWTQYAYIKTSDPDQLDGLIRCALDNGILAISSIWEDSAATGVDGDQSDNSVEDSGAVYIFE